MTVMSMEDEIVSIMVPVTYNSYIPICESSLLYIWSSSKLESNVNIELSNSELS